MKSPILYLILVVLLTAAGAGLFAQTSSEDPISFKDWTELEEYLASHSDALLLDVRTSEEYGAGHIPGAILLPYDEIEGNPPSWEKDTPIVVYCRSGHRASIALQTLNSQGYKNVVNFGGISQWKGILNSGLKP
jgi:phage shock protein E